MTVKNDDQLQQYYAEAQILRAKIERAEDEVAHKKFQALVGKCFTRRDSYGDSIGWPIYVRIFKYRGRNSVEVEFFARRSDNTVTYEPAQHHGMDHFTSEDWTEITLQHYFQAKAEIINFLQKPRHLPPDKRKR